MSVAVVSAGAAAPRKRTAAGAVRAPDDVQVGMVEVDPGVDDRHVDVHPLVVHAVDVEVRIPRREDPPDAGRDGLRLDRELLDGLDVGDEGISADCRRGLCGGAIGSSVPSPASPGSRSHRDASAES
jgi:hypothetical protein